MVERYLLHTRDNQNERSQLYGLALLRRAQIPTSIAAALGLAQADVTTNYTKALRQLHRRYSFIFTENEQPTLHQEVRHFLRNWLLEHHKLPEIVAVNERLKRTQDAALKELEERRQYKNLRERLEDQEWVEIYLDLTEQYFWLDPVQGLDYALPFMLAAAIYRRDINHDTIKIGSYFENLIPQPYHRRWEWAAQSLIYRTSFDPSREELNGLEELAKLPNHRFPHFSQSLLANGFQKELEGALYWRLGEAYKGKNEKKALEWYEKALNRLGYEVELCETGAISAYYIAVSLYKEREYTESLSFFNRATKLDPTIPYIYSDRGNTFSKIQEYQLAIVDYNRAIELDPSHNHFYNNRGITYNKMKEYELAIADYNYAIELDPTDPIIYNNRALTYTHIQEYQLAINDYSRAIELDSTNFTAYNNRGSNYCRIKSYQDAITDFSLAIELNSSQVNPYKNRGKAYFYIKKYEQAITDFTKAIALDDKDTWIVALRGKAYHNTRHYHEALIDYSQAITLGHKDAQTFADRGEVYRRLGRYNEALADLDSAIALDEKHICAYAYRGDTYYDLGHYQESLDDFNQVIELDPTQMHSIYTSRGLALSNLGRYAEAIESYKNGEEEPNNYTSLYNIAVAMISLRGLAPSQVYIERARMALLAVIDTDAHGGAAYGLGGLAAATGNVSEALSYLNEAVVHEKEAIRWARHDIAWRSLHGYPNFEKLVPKYIHGTDVV